MTTAQLEYTAEELLADSPIDVPLIAGGHVCHGGFDGDGRYVSPRTRHRVPAIAAWQANHTATFGTPMLDVPLSTWPGQYPNVAQARLLIERGVAEPMMAALTRIGTVEGFGADIRLLHPTDFQEKFVEDVRGTALDHLDRGLFEAHGRDEAGWGDKAGHRDMWFAARDIAFAGRTADLDIDAMLTRLGFGPAATDAPGTPPHALPADIDPELEIIVDVMIRVLLIEIQAYHTFAVGRGVAERRRPRRRRRRRRHAGVVRPRRRVAARGVPQDCAHRAARPHMDRHERRPLRRDGHDRSAVGARPRALARPAAPRRQAVDPRRGRVLVRASDPTAPTCSPSSTRSPARCRRFRPCASSSWRETPKMGRRSPTSSGCRCPTGQSCSRCATCGRERPRSTVIRRWDGPTTPRSSSGWRCAVPAPWGERRPRARPGTREPVAVRLHSRARSRGDLLAVGSHGAPGAAERGAADGTGCRPAIGDPGRRSRAVPVDVRASASESRSAARCPLATMPSRWTGRSWPRWSASRLPISSRR